MRQIIILYALLIGYLGLDSFVLSSSGIEYYNSIITPCIWIGLCLFAFYLGKNSDLRINDKKNKTQSLIVALIIYIIIYFLLGLILGFQRTPYSKTPLNIMFNIWMFGSIVVFQEFIRFNIIKIEPKKKWNLVAVTILFILFTISINGISAQFSTLKDGFIYVASTLLPAIAAGVLMTYLSYIGGASLPIIYRLVILLPEFIVPIIPDLDWFVSAIIGLSLPIIVFVYLNYVHISKKQRLSKRDRKKYNPIVYAPAFAFIALAAGFVMGLFKYQPIAIVSGSMSPIINRGDAVVIKKLDEKEKRELKVDDIIEFTSGNKTVVHRIIRVTNNNNGDVVFVTKGDANNTEDLGTVSTDQIKGKQIYTIPYIGYPSVWLSDIVE